MTKKAQLQILGQPRFLIMITCILVGFIIANKYGGGEMGALIGFAVGVVLWRFL